MSRSKRITLTMALFAFFAFGITWLAYADEEALGRQAEQAGNLRQALNHYVAAIQSATEGGSKDLELREKIIKLAQTIQPSPAVSEEAERHMSRGRAAVEMASKPEDFQDAIKEFRKALVLAPWLGDAYYNLGVIQEKAGYYKDAIRSFKLYLLAAPSAADVREVRQRIYGLEYKAEKHWEEERAKEAKLREERSICKALVGVWRYYLSDHYDDHLHYEIEVVGNEVVMTQVVDITMGKKYRAGDITGSSRYQLDGRRLIRNGKVEYEVSKDLKKLVKRYMYSGRKITHIYHKCRTISVGSCGK